MMEEIWKDIEGYEGLYQVSNWGRIKALEKQIEMPHGGLKSYEEIIKKQHTHPNGYKILRLSKDGQAASLKVHRLVAISFIQNPENKPEVNHMDGIKANNMASNLEWTTHQENSKHAFNNIPRKSIKGSNSPLSKEIVKCSENGEVLDIYESIGDASRKIQIQRTSISQYLRNIRRDPLGFIWKYKEKTNFIELNHSKLNEMKKLIVFLIACIFLNACNNSQSPQTVVSTQDTVINGIVIPLIHGTAANIVSAYDENEASADVFFKNKRVLVYGRSISIEKDFSGSVFVKLQGDKYGHCVNALMLDGDTTVLKIRKGQYVSIAGTCTGLFLGAVVIRDCIIEPVTINSQ